MRKAICAVLAVLGISLTASALAPAANAGSSVYPPTQYEGNNN